MRCSCCGQWKVRAAVLSRDANAELPVLRLTHCGYLVGEYRTPEEIAAALAEAGVDFAGLVDDTPPPAPEGTGRPRRARPARSLRVPSPA